MNKYDSEPVFYCQDCFSLFIKSVAGVDYCCKCGSTTVKEAKDIFEWRKLRSEKYKKKQH